MRISLPLLDLVLCAGVARGAGFDPATLAIRLTDLDAGVIPTAIKNVGQVAGQAAGALCFAEVGDFSFSPANWKA